jgi:uncharacterized protein YukE
MHDEREGLGVEKVVIDGALLDDMVSSLARIRNEFDGANGESHDVAVAVGHMALGERVLAFAEGWDHRRSELSEQLTSLGEQLTSVRDGFESVDNDLAAALTEES